jgi:predicted RecB family nuclease
MDRGDDDTLILGADDLSGHLACRHLVHLERLAVAGTLDRPESGDAGRAVAHRREREHRAAVIAEVSSGGRSLVAIGPGGSGPAAIRAASEATAAAVRAGTELVVDPVFFDGTWWSSAAYLLRVPGPRPGGGCLYEVVGTQLARRVTPDLLLALAAAGEHLAQLGPSVSSLVVVTGGGTHHAHGLDEVAAYRRRVARRLEQVVAGGGGVPYPAPVPLCRHCPWEPRCDARRRADGHLSLVAGMRRELASAWHGAGVATVADLAASPLGVPVPGMGLGDADRLRHQARMQLAQWADGRVRYELLAPTPPAPDGGSHGEAPVEGLASLPAPAPGDLFFDIEGDPWVGRHGLEYLFGLVDLGADGPAYRAFWAHTAEEEQAALEQVVDLLLERHEADPAMHVYHYAPYEVRVLRRLARRYRTRQAEVARLIGAGVFVDLYRIVRQSVRISQEGYGLKKLEPLYLDGRDGTITDGGSSIVAYEAWLASGDPQLLDDLAAYNEVDCRSTLGLRDWLEERRSELEAALGAPLSRPLAEVAADDAVAAAPAGAPAGATVAPAVVARPAWSGRIAEGPIVSGAGVRLQLVAHHGNRTRSPEEAAAVAAIVEALLGRSVTDGSGAARPLRLDDVVIVTPLDDQVPCLLEALPEGSRVRTVGALPAPEAAVVVYSAAASSIAAVPWGQGRHLTRSGLDTALAGAGTLAVVVAGVSLLESSCRTVEQLRLVNTLCRLAEDGPLIGTSPQSRPDRGRQVGQCALVEP